MYTALNAKIELLFKIVDILLTKLTVAGCPVFAVLLTLVYYFVLDFGAESYYLPIPMLYVPMPIGDVMF